MSGTTSPIVTTGALWTWNTSNPVNPVVETYSSGAVTKTGLLPADLINFVGFGQLSYFTTPPTTIPDPVILGWIRSAEDMVEQKTGLLLCQTWVASPPARLPEQMASLSLQSISGSGGQVQGVDYDLADAGYDFMYDRSQDNAWMAQKLRYKPLRTQDSRMPTAMKNYAYIYPLLSDYFRVPVQWFVEDQDFAYVRLVPSANVQMLPLFALQLTVNGFSDSVPMGIWIQYVAGLTTYDYQTRFSFVQQLVLSLAACMALTTMQGALNFGAIETNLSMDGLMTKIRYSENGALAGQIKTFAAQATSLMATLNSMVSGPKLTFL